MSEIDVEYLNDSRDVAMREVCVGQYRFPLIKFPSGFVIHVQYLKIRQRIKNFKVLPDDVWICGHPKCGTTWTREMVWLLGNGIDFKTAKSINLLKRVRDLEFSDICPEVETTPDHVSIAETLPSPRFIITHLPAEELPEELFAVNPKVIYIQRNPKDTVISWYHFFVNFKNYPGTLEDFMEIFLDDRVYYGPYWHNVLGFWKLRDKKNLLIISYEDMITDLAKVMKKTADFMGVTYSKEQETELLDHLSFKAMKKNKMVNNDDHLRKMGNEKFSFIRKGEVGSWKKDMSSKYVDMFDKWTEKWLEGSDFPYYRK